MDPKKDEFVDKTTEKQISNPINSGIYGNSVNDKDPKENIDTFLESMKKMHMDDMKKYMPQGSLTQYSMPGLVSLPGKFNSGFDNSQERNVLNDQIQQISPEALANIQKYDEDKKLLLNSDLNNDLQSMSKSFEDIEKQRNQKNIRNSAQNSEVSKMPDYVTEDKNEDNFMKSIQGDTIPILNKLVIEKDRNTSSKKSTETAKVEPGPMPIENTGYISQMPSDPKQNDTNKRTLGEQPSPPHQEMQSESPHKNENLNQIPTLATNKGQTQNISQPSKDNSSLPVDKGETDQNKIHDVLLGENHFTNQIKQEKVTANQGKMDKKLNSPSNGDKIVNKEKSSKTDDNDSKKKAVTSSKEKIPPKKSDSKTQEIDRVKQSVLSGTNKEIPIGSQPEKDKKEKENSKDKKGSDKPKEEKTDKKAKDKKDNKEQDNDESKEDRNILPLPQPFDKDEKVLPPTHKTKPTNVKKQGDSQKAEEKEDIKPPSTVLHQTIQVSIQPPDLKSDSADVHTGKNKDDTSIKITSKIRGAGKNKGKSQSKENDSVFTNNNSKIQPGTELLTDKGIIKPENTLSGRNSEKYPSQEHNLSNVEKISKNYTESTPIFRNLAESKESKKKSMTKDSKKNDKPHRKVQILPNKSKETRKTIVPIIKFKLEGPNEHEGEYNGKLTRESTSINRKYEEGIGISNNKPIQNDSSSEDSQFYDDSDHMEVDHENTSKSGSVFNPSKRSVENESASQNRSYIYESSAQDSLESESDQGYDEQSLYDMDQRNDGPMSGKFDKYSL